MVRLVVKHVWSVMSAFSVLRRTAAAPQGSRLITSAPQPTVTASPTTNSTGSAGPCLDGWCMWSTGDGKKTAYSTLVLVSPFIFKEPRLFSYPDTRHYLEWRSKRSFGHYKCGWMVNKWMRPQLVLGSSCSQHDLHRPCYL